MEDKRAKYTFRPAGMGNSPANNSAVAGRMRSQWHGMDLHTSTPSTHRRAMYNPQPQPTTQAASTSTAAVATAAAAARTKAEDAAISARNLLLRRKLSERKRFDSADYAMKKVMTVMDTPGDADSEAQPQVQTDLQSHAKIGASVLLTALDDGAGHQMAKEDEEMPLQDPQADARSQIQPQQQQRASRYGALGGGSATGALTARNIVIQHKLQEKRHFDSADWQLKRYGKAEDVTMEMAPPLVTSEPVAQRHPLVINQASSPMNLNITTDETTTPVSSPSAASLTATRNARLSPTVRDQRAMAAQGDKYTGLSGTEVVMQRKLAEKKRFDSADYNMVTAARNAGTSSGSSSDNMLRRNILLRQQQNYIARQEAAASITTVPPETGEGIVNPPAAPQDFSAESLASQAVEASKYGKLCAAQLIIRKKLKERKRFDSADYHMQQANKQGQSQSDSMSSDSSKTFTAPASPLVTPQTKHMKLSEGAAPSRWASHSAVVASRQTVDVPLDASVEGRLAARSVLIHRKLSERKRFDSADHFAAKEAAQQKSNRSHAA